MQQHKHEYEAVFHPALSAEARELGITGAEIRRCKACPKEMTFVLVRERWFPLFEEKEADEKDILLA
jgi:hypothetical protein